MSAVTPCRAVAARPAAAHISIVLRVRGAGPPRPGPGPATSHNIVFMCGRLARVASCSPPTAPATATATIVATVMIMAMAMAMVSVSGSVCFVIVEACY